MERNLKVCGVFVAEQLWRGRQMETFGLRRIGSGVLADESVEMVDWF